MIAMNAQAARETKVYQTKIYYFILAKAFAIEESLEGREALSIEQNKVRKLLVDSLFVR